MKPEVEIAIIGAGVVGLAIAAEISENGRDIFVFEKNRSFGLETSSRNSEVIHSGIYYPENSLKAKLCVEGRTLIYELCQKHNIPHQRLGKMTIAIEDQEIKELEKLYEQGKANGVEDLAILSRDEFKRLEPNAEARAALFSPCSGILDVYAFMRFLHQKAEQNGAQFVFQSEVAGIEKINHGYEVTVKDRQGIESFTAQIVINTAGLHSDKIAQLAGIDINTAGYKLHYCKGEYFSVNPRKRGLAKRLIYPIPKQSRTRLHWCVGVDGRTRLGPYYYYVDKIDYSINASQRETFYSSAQKFFPSLELEDLEPESTGIIPKLQGPGKSFRDFVIKHEEERQLPGFINLVGIESPGLTSSLAIAKYVAGLGII
jgi:L-2-hydroxyglutarate oxidase LhgO